MHVVVWTAGDVRYAIETACIVEVVPVVDVRAIPHCPPWVCGLMNYRGALTPLVDVRRLIDDHATEPRRATRIIVTELGGELGAELVGDRLALLVESLESVEHCDFADADAHPGLTLPDARYLGPVAPTTNGTLQLVDVHRLLDDEHRALLFDRTPAEGP